MVVGTLSNPMASSVGIHLVGHEAKSIKLLGKSCKVRLTQSDFTIMSDGDSHTFLWKRFKSFLLDAENLYLFLVPSLAYILPIRQVGEAAIDFAKAHVETNSV
jgi:hypothetical protein